MRAYYYLMAQLPNLTYEQKPYLPSMEFRQFVKPFLSEEDASLMEHISLEPEIHSDSKPTGCAFIDNFREWNSTFRKNLARGRAAKLKRDLPAFDPPSSPADAAAAAARVLNTESTPLAAEIMLDNIRWNVIENLAGYDYFSRNNVYAYLLKLMILERRELFNAETGFTEYKSLYSAIIEKARSENI